MGFDIKDIVSFMTSPVITFIDTITESNIFTDIDISIDAAIEIAKGNYEKLIKSILSKSTLSKLEDNLEPNDLLFKKLIAGNIDNINISEYFNNKSKQGYKEFAELIHTIDEINKLKNFNVNEESLADLQEFSNALEGANEFSAFGTILGLNQGIGTSKVLILKRILQLQRILVDRLKKTGNNSISLDVKRYFTDSVYKKKIKDKYNDVKKCINIFDAIDHIPQFNSIFLIFSGVIDVTSAISIKERAFNEAYEGIKDNRMYMPELYQNKLLQGIDNYIISKFIKEHLNIAVPYKKGSRLTTNTREVIETNDDGLLTFDTLNDIASFKLLFENTIIPNLKKGTIYDYIDNKVVKRMDTNLLNNKFIQFLIRGKDRDVPLYKCNIDMLNIDSSPNSKIKFQLYLNGLRELESILINGTKLSDLFVLYNLIVNKNLYGSDRMTTLFASFIQLNKELSLINEYLEYVGDLDYNGDVKSLNIRLKDLMKFASPIVNSETGQEDPSIIVKTDKGFVFMIKERGGYRIDEELIPKIEKEDDDRRVRRIYNHFSYFVLGAPYSGDIDKHIDNILKLNDNVLLSLNRIVQEGILKILKICE